MGNGEKERQGQETGMNPECEDCSLEPLFAASVFQPEVVWVSSAEKWLHGVGGGAGKGVGLCERTGQPGGAPTWGGW